jgi:general L-amino acid transport system permease protein
MIYQWGLVAVFILTVIWVVDTASTNLDRLGIKTGFEFLSVEAGFQISPALLPYTPQSTYGQAILVTLINTIVLSLIAIVLATFLGFFLAISRLSKNWLLRNLAVAYVEIFRNVPLLLHFFFWYFAALKLLPGKRQSINFFNVALGVGETAANQYRRAVSQTSGCSDHRHCDSASHPMGERISGDLGYSKIRSVEF